MNSQGLNLSKIPLVSQANGSNQMWVRQNQFSLLQEKIKGQFSYVKREAVEKKVEEWGGICLAGECKGKGPVDIHGLPTGRV